MRADFWFNVQKQPLADSSGGSVAKKSHSGPRMESHPSDRHPLVVVLLLVLMTHTNRGNHGSGILDVLQSTASLTSFYLLCRLVYIPFLDQWRRITFIRLVLNMSKGHHQLRVQPPLFFNFYWFNIKAAPAHHPVTQNEV